jgi:hypothetical protein
MAMAPIPAPQALWRKAQGHPADEGLTGWRSTHRPAPEQC